MNSKDQDHNRGERDQGFLDKQKAGSSSGGVENWAPPQQSSGRYSDWGSDSEPRSTQAAGAANVNAGPVQQGNGMAISGFVLSIISLVFCWVVIYNLVVIVPALVFSAIGMRKANRERRPHGGIAVAGVVISIVAFILMVLVIIWLRNELSN